MLVAASRRYARVDHEAEDVAQDVLLAALGRGLALDGEAFSRAADASARQHAAFVARSAARRRARELRCAVDPGGAEADEPCDGEGAPAESLPSVLRTTLLLLSLGHTKSELRSALGITDAALRKRIQGLRERSPLARPRFSGPRVSSPGLRRAQIACLPRLAPKLNGGRLIAVSDGDGHGIIFSEALTNATGTATSHASVTLSGSEAL